MRRILWFQNLQKFEGMLKKSDWAHFKLNNSLNHIPFTMFLYTLMWWFPKFFLSFPGSSAVCSHTLSMPVQNTWNYLKGTEQILHHPSTFSKKKLGFLYHYKCWHGWLMAACWVLRSRLIYFWRNMNISSIFYFSKSTSINRPTQYSSLCMGHSEDDAVHKIPKWKCIGRISRKCQCRPFQMRAWSCITSYPLWGLPYLAYDNVNPAMVNSMMLHSSMHDLKSSIGLIQNPLQNLIQKDVIGLLAQCPF